MLYDHCVKWKWKLHLNTPLIKKKVCGIVSFFTFNTKNSTNIFYINIYGYQPVEYYIIYSTKKLNAASSSRLHKWETGRFW